MINVEQLIRKAMEVREHAYAPYSNFKVGCALLAEDGSYHLGCNVENAAYGPTNCAERTALFRAIADGERRLSFKALAIVGGMAGSDDVGNVKERQQLLTPCGVCRQVMIELCSLDMPVMMGTLNGDYIETTVHELMPWAFSQEVLYGKREV